MADYILKSALVAEIERRRDAALMRQKNLESIGQESVINEMVANELSRIISFINTFEVKEVDLNEEFDKYFFNFVDPDTGEKLKRTECWLNIRQARKFAKHFFELGLSVSNSTKVTTPDIDDVLKENGVNPDSKEAKIIKESYFMAIEKLAQKGE